MLFTARGSRIELSVDATSEAVLIDPEWAPAGSMSVARANQARRRQGSWSSVAGLGAVRYMHTGTLLNDGRVLVASGYGTGGNLASAMIYNVSTNSWSTTGALNDARVGHTATLLDGGNVFVTGGYNATTVFKKAEYYTP